MGNREQESFFRRVTRYPDGAKSTPRENRLTEAFAALLQHGDSGLTWAVAEYLGSPIDRAGRDSPVEVRTQEYVRGHGAHGYVDLLLLIPRVDGGSQSLAVEVKHGSGISGGQLDVYVDHADSVVVLAPRRDISELEDGLKSDHPTVTCVAWQDVAKLIEAYQQKDPVGSWLQAEFIKFLREEKLMESNPITKSELDAWANHLTAAAALKDVLRYAVEYVEASVDSDEQTETTKHQAFRYGSWWHFPQFQRPKGAPEGAWFEFKVCGPDELPEDLGKTEKSDLMFMAGLSADKGVSLSSLRPSGDKGKAYFEFTEARCSRLMRVCSPRERFTDTAGSIEEQGKALGEWISESFKVLSSC